MCSVTPFMPYIHLIETNNDIFSVIFWSMLHVALFTFLSFLKQTWRHTLITVLFIYALFPLKTLILKKKLKFFRAGELKIGQWCGRPNKIYIRSNMAMAYR
jgi:hypothetical protein